MTRGRATLHDTLMGVEEILMRIDGVPYADIMKSFELIGREVIPKVDPRAAIA